MTQPNQRVYHCADTLRYLAIGITQALEHIQRELADGTIWPTTTMPERTSGGTPSSPQESAAMLGTDIRNSLIDADGNGPTLGGAYNLRDRREDMRDWIAGLEEHIREGRRIVDATLRTRIAGLPGIPVAPQAQRCNGAIDPTCTNWASDHHHPDNGTTIEGLCDDCFTAACRTCKRKPRESGRTVCAGCRKDSQRRRAA